jgi:uncharacterized membrane protein YqaE (UPF0057 family)
MPCCGGGAPQVLQGGGGCAKRMLVFYLLAILLPPIAVLCCGKPLQALLNLVLTLFLYFPGAVHALFVVNAHLADKRAERLVRELRGDPKS